jgi:hypothetical protein
MLYSGMKLKAKLSLSATLIEQSRKMKLFLNFQAGQMLA